MDEFYKLLDAVIENARSDEYDKVDESDYGRAAREALVEWVRVRVERGPVGCGCKYPDAFGCARYGGGSSCNCACHDAALTDKESRHG